VNNGSGHSETHSRHYRHPALAAAAGGETTMKRSLRILRRRQWIFLLIAGGMFSLACVYAYSRPTSYRSEASIEVGAETPLSPTMLLGDAPGTRSMPPWAHHFKTQEALLKREGLLKQVLDSLPKGFVQPYLDSRDPVRKLARQMEVADIPDTFVIKVALDHPNSDGGPQIVNRLIDLYIEDSNKRLHAQILGVLEDLEKKTLPEIHSKVAAAEKKLQEFVLKYGAGSIADRHASLLEQRRRLADHIFEMRMRAITLRWDPDRRDLLDDPAGALASPRLIDSLLGERGRLEMEIAKQSAILKPGHPAMIGLNNQLEAINKRLNEAITLATSSRDRVTEAVAKRLEQQLKDADGALKSLMTDEKDVTEAIAEASQQRAEYEKLDGELKAATAIYNTYLTKQAEVKAMAGAGVASVRIVDRANTPLGTRKDTQLIILLGAVLGLLFGAAAVVIAEQNDDKASTPYEAEAAVGLDVLVSIPKLSKPLGSRHPVIPKDHPLKSPLEPFRRLRLEVAARLHNVEGSRVVAVVGAGFNEGKSTVAINLARVLGLEKRKVLLVDGEFRNPKLKALLADEKAPGLEEFIRTDAHFRDAVQPTKLANVDLLGASKSMEEAPEIPSLERFRDLWDKARSFYDYVIIDAGPVNAYSESAAVATKADAAILVMDEGRSPLRDVVSARRVLENLEVKILGLIVNRSLNPAAGGLVSRLIAEAHAKTNGHATNAEAAAPAPAPAPFMTPVIVAEGPGEDPALRAVLDRLFVEMDSTKQRAASLETEKATLSQREMQLKQAHEELEREHSRLLEGELRKNVELAQKFTEFVETSRNKEEEQLKKLEIIFTKSLEGVNKKLTDLRLRSFAGGGGGGGGMEGDLQLRPSQATIDGIFNQKIESNMGAMDQPKEKKGGTVNNALDRLKNMRNNTPKKDEDKK
jgi:capsular exopolysaccharide synthesis family protein